MQAGPNNAPDFAGFAEVQSNQTPLGCQPQRHLSLLACLLPRLLPRRLKCVLSANYKCAPATIKSGDSNKMGTACMPALIKIQRW